MARDLKSPIDADWRPPRLHLGYAGVAKARFGGIAT
jgi:hypothetical protein